MRVVRSFAKEEAELAALDERIDRHRALSWANTRAATTLGATATLISGVGTVFVISYGVVLVGRGVLSVGELLAFYALVGQLYAPIVRLTQFQATALATHISVERLYEIFDEPEPVRDRGAARAITHPRGTLEFRAVHFSYAYTATHTARTPPAGGPIATARRTGQASPPRGRGPGPRCSTASA